MIDKQVLLEIGSNVTIDIKLIDDRLPSEIESLLIRDSRCIIIDYKMTDGKGIGYVVKLIDGRKYWFFEKEIRHLDVDTSSLSLLVDDKNKNQQLFEDSDNLMEYQTKFPDPNLDSELINSLSYYVNPFNFIKWLLYSTKDVF